MLTIKLKDFGKLLITRQHAKEILQSCEITEAPILDFDGVMVANHPFMDELGKGLVASLTLTNFSQVQVTGTNPCVDNFVHAGFATATA